MRRRWRSGAMRLGCRTRSTRVIRTNAQGHDDTATQVYTRTNTHPTGTHTHIYTHTVTQTPVGPPPARTPTHAPAPVDTCILHTYNTLYIRIPEPTHPLSHTHTHTLVTAIAPQYLCPIHAPPPCPRVQARRLLCAARKCGQRALQANAHRTTRGWDWHATHMTKINKSKSEMRYHLNAASLRPFTLTQNLGRNHTI